MRKIISILMLILIAGMFSAVNAQTQTDEPADAVLGYGSSSSYVIAGLSSADTIGLNDSTWTYVLRDKSQKRLMYHATISLDSISDSRDTTTVDVKLYDKVSSEQAYTERQSFTWNSGADTTGSLTTSSFRVSEFVKIEVTGEFDEFKVKPSYLFIKSVEE